MAKKLSKAKASEMLHNPPHGKPLTDKQRKYFGAIASGQPDWLNKYETGGSMQEHQENYNDASVSLPPNFVGMNNNTKGFDYNSAWGGRWQNGGRMAQEGEKIFNTPLKIDPNTGRPIRPSDRSRIKPWNNVHIPGAPYSSEPTDVVRGYDPVKKAIRKGLHYADVATDLMQVGNFIPHPVAQGVGLAGNLLGAGVDAAQAYDAYNQGDYAGAGFNAATALLPFATEGLGYTRAIANATPGTTAENIANIGGPVAGKEGWYIPLTALPHLKGNPVIKKGLMENKTVLGALAGETAYDYENGGTIPGANGFMYARHGAPSNGKYAKMTLPSAENGREMQYYQQGLDFKPKSISKNGMTASADATRVNRPPIDYNAINIAKYIKDAERQDELLRQAQPTATIGPRSAEQRYTPSEPQFLPDLGTRMLHAVETFGGSAVADAVQGISPQAAGWLDKYSAGMFPVTSEEQLERGRSDNENRWLNRAGMTADAASSVLAGELIGAGMQGGASKLAGKLVQSPSSSADFSDVARTTKNALAMLKTNINPTFQKESAIQLEKANKYIRDWYSHPETIKKFKNTTTEEAEDVLHRLGISPWDVDVQDYVTNKINERVSTFADRISKGNADVQYNPVVKNVWNKIMKGETPKVGPKARGTSWTHPETLQSENYVRREMSPYQRGNTMVHEASHGADAGGDLLNAREVELLEGPFNINRRYESPTTQYLLDPTEIRARKQQILYSENAQPDTYFNQNAINHMIEKGRAGGYKIDPEWFELIDSPARFQDMMNKMWGTVPVAVGAGAAASQQKRNGGKAKEGATLQLDKLDQLTNFTNYNKPTRGGWLDKYK